MPKETTPEWEKELKSLEMKVAGGNLDGCLVYHQSVKSLISDARQQAIEEVIDYISFNEGWEETGDKYRKVFSIKPKFSK